VQTDPSQIYSTINEDTGFISDSLINKGRGNNYGLEISVDRSFGNNFYYIINGTVFNSSFGVGEGEARNTAYDGNYSIHALCGKEFEISGKKNRVGINVKITQAGGRRYVPIDIERSINEKRQVHNWDEAFDHQLPSYFRADLQIVYRINRPRYTFEWRLDIQNVTNHRNAAWYYYDASDDRVKLKNQVGIVPLLSCRIDF
jgi:outer membrane receptor protein involved in Fe transport